MSLYNTFNWLYANTYMFVATVRQWLKERDIYELFFLTIGSAVWFFFAGLIGGWLVKEDGLTFVLIAFWISCTIVLGLSQQLDTAKEWFWIPTTVFAFCVVSSFVGLLLMNLMRFFT